MKPKLFSGYAPVTMMLSMGFLRGIGFIIIGMVRIIWFITTTTIIAVVTTATVILDLGFLRKIRMVGIILVIINSILKMVVEMVIINFV